MGITPACAGNRIFMSLSEAFWEDHPRVCGEQQALWNISQVPKGSPPRVRGTASNSVASKVFSRITPACAGNRGIFPFAESPTADHPRVCGEQTSTTSRMLWVVGSPPRVRGTAVPDVPDLLPLRITPACAGNSRIPSHHRAPAQDHPRVCGEQLKSVADMLGVLGSPPRVRGTDDRVDCGLASTGITPACAGNRPRPPQPYTWP